MQPKEDHLELIGACNLRTSTDNDDCTSSYIQKSGHESARLDKDVADWIRKEQYVVGGSSETQRLHLMNMKDAFVR